VLGLDNGRFASFREGFKALDSEWVYDMTAEYLAWDDGW
jgi:hypothetical protein